MTNADLKAAANVYVNNVALYNGYINQAKSLESSNPQEAIKQLELAQSLNPNGPNNPAGMMAALRKPAQAKTAPTPATPTPKAAADSVAENAKKMAKLSDDARNAEDVYKRQPQSQPPTPRTEKRPGCPTLLLTIRSERFGLHSHSTISLFCCAANEPIRPLTVSRERAKSTTVGPLPLRVH